MKPKGRPKKQRHIDGKPLIVQFSPRGRPGRPEEIQLRIDEFEAIRLADTRGLKQQDAARLMAVSRQTFGRIIRVARCKVADALVNGKIIRVV